MSETVMPGAGAEASTFLISPPRREEWNQQTVDELLAHLSTRLPALTFHVMLHTPMGDDQLFSCVPLLNGPSYAEDDADGYMRILRRPSEATIDLIALALNDFPPQTARATANALATVGSSLRLAQLGQRRQIH